MARQATCARLCPCSRAREAQIKILDAAGNTVQTIRGTRNAGLNRVWWNLRNENSKEVRLRTLPLYAPDIKLNNDGWRPLPEGGRMTVLMPPGTYTAKLIVDGQEDFRPAQQELIQSFDNLISALENGGRATRGGRASLSISEMRTFMSMPPYAGHQSCSNRIRASDSSVMTSASKANRTLSVPWLGYRIYVRIPRSDNFDKCYDSNIGG